MDDQTEPDWELLSADPWKFFGIQHDAETRDLKRSYNRFIRRFKPEKHPLEFQRIRAAYEYVHNQIRYGENDKGPSIQFDWTSAFSSSHGKTESRANEINDENSSAKPTLTLMERIESESAPKLLAELAAQPAKSPRDYFHLAVLDSIQPPSDESLENWLLEGIVNHPREHGLSGLFREYLEHHLVADRLSDVLCKSLEKLPASQFFQITEPAWDRLIRERSFEEFRATLARSEEKMTIVSGHSIVIFYLHILKPAIWKSDDEWLEQVTAEIEDQYYQLPNWAQHEYEVLCHLSEYRQSEHAQKQHGLLQSMNEAIQQWCLDVDGKSDRTIVECQHLIAANGMQLLDEFPADNPVSYTH